MRILKRLVIGGGALLAALFIAGQIWARTAPRPTNLGVNNGQLAPCPSTPNCVATTGANDSQLMAPLTYTSAQADAQARLKQALQTIPRTTIIADEPGYVAVEFRSRVFGFIDDGEFRFDDNAKQIHFRSAARLGRGDGGVNRRRMTAIVDAFNRAAVMP